MRPNRLAAGLAHSPCSQLHARLAGDIAASAGRLLPHRFSPDPHRPKPTPGGNSFCCGCSRLTLQSGAPTCCFVGQPSARKRSGSREVPLTHSRTPATVAQSLIWCSCLPAAIIPCARIKVKRLSKSRGRCSPIRRGGLGNGSRACDRPRWRFGNGSRVQCEWLCFYDEVSAAARPLHPVGSIRPHLFLPNRRDGLEALDGVAAGVKRAGAVRGGDGNDDARFPDL